MPTPIAFGLPPSNPRHGWWAANVVWDLRDNDPETSIREFVLQDWAFITKMQFIPSTPDFPAVCVLQMGGDLFVAIDGTDSLSQVVSQLAGYYGSLLTNPTDPINTWYQMRANALINTIISQFGTPSGTCCVAGWSLGGAVAEFIGALWPTYPSKPRRMVVATFGSPRPGGRSFQGQLGANASVARWMNSNDPVPLVPPSPVECPAITLAYGVQGALLASNFLQPDGGINLAADGTPSRSVLPSQASVSFTGALANWLFQLDQPGNAQHAISLYVSQLAKIQSGPEVRPAPGNTGVEAPSVTSVASVTKAFQPLVDTIFNRQGLQNSVAVAVPDVNRFKATHEGRVWSVSYQGEPVVIVGRKKKAKALARALNYAMVQLQTSAVVDPTAVEAAIEDYLASAAEPGTGFSPVLNTSF